nr:MAG TPA: hypothetical protein [Caudoviricetes sp.]
MFVKRCSPSLELHLFIYRSGCYIHLPNVANCDTWGSVSRPHKQRTPCFPIPFYT